MPYKRKFLFNRLYHLDDTIKKGRFDDNKMFVSPEYDVRVTEKVKNYVQKNN